MRKLRAILALTAVVGALALTGCAADPDVSGLEASIAESGGVNGVIADVQHPGAPWNTEIGLLLCLDDVSDDAVIDSVHRVAPVLAADDATAGRTVSLAFIDGVCADYADRRAALNDRIRVMDVVHETFGVADSGSAFLTLTPR